MTPNKYSDSVPGKLEDLRTRVENLERSQKAQTDTLTAQNTTLESIETTVSSIRDMLITGRVMTAALKWLAALAAGVLSLWVLAQKAFPHVGH